MSCAVAIVRLLVQCPGEQPAVGRPVEAQVEHARAEVPAGTGLHPPELALTVTRTARRTRTGCSPPPTGLDPVGIDGKDQVEPPAPQELGRCGIPSLDVDGLGIDTH